MSIKKAWCPACKAPLMESLTEDGRKIMIDWEPFFGTVTKDGIYFLIKGETNSPTVKRFALTDEWPENATPWSAHSNTCKGGKK